MWENRFGKDGDQVDTFFGCCSGYALLDQNTETYTCANLTNSSTWKLRIFFIVANGNKTLIYIECVKNWKAQYYCLTEEIKAVQIYIDIFFKTLKSLKEKNDNRITNRYTLNSELLSLYYFETVHYKLKGANECIRNVYYR